MKRTLSSIVAAVFSVFGFANAAETESRETKTPSASRLQVVNVDQATTKEMREYKAMTYWYPRLYIEGAAGNKRVLGILDGMIPIWGNSNNLWYFDARGQISSQNSNEGNFGTGYRHLTADGNSIYGIYGFYDRMDSPNSNIFNQMTFGVERLGHDWDYRINGYLPFGKTQYAINNTNTPPAFSGHQVITTDTTTYESAQAGFDAEVGRKLWGGPYHPLRAYVGYYYFGFDKNTPGMNGVRVRAVQTVTHWFDVSVGVEYDAIRQMQYLVGFRFKLGGVNSALWKADPNDLRNRMMSAVTRDLDVVTVDTRHQTIDVLSPEPVYFINQGAAAGGDGTYQHPYNTITQSDIGAAGQNSMIYVQGAGPNNTDRRYTYDLQSGVHLETGQTFRTSSTDYDVMYQGHPYTVLGSTQAPIITASQLASNQAAMTVASGDDVSGFTLQGANGQGQGINVDNANHVNLHQIAVSGFAEGVNVTGTGSQVVNINDVASEHNTRAGISINDHASQINLNNIDADNNTQGYGVVFSNVSNVDLNAVANSNDILDLDNDTDSLAILNANNVTMGNIAVQNINNDGVLIQNSSHVRLGNLTVSGAQGDGVNINHVMDSSFGNINVSDSQDNGVNISNTRSSSFGNVSVNASQADGVSLTNDSQLQIGTITAANNVAAGVDISGNYTGLSIHAVDAQHNQTGVVLSNTNTVSGTNGNLNISNIDAEQNQIGVNFSGASYANVGNITADNNIDGGLLFSNNTIGDNIGTLTATGNTGYSLERDHASNIDLGSDVNQSDAIDLSDDTDGVSILNADNVTLGNLSIQDSRDNGVLVQNSNHIHLGNLTVSGAQGDGINMSDVTDSNVGNITVSDSQGDGVNMSNVTGSSFGNTDVTDSQGVGVLLNNVSHLQMGTITSSGQGANDNGVEVENANNLDLGNISVSGSENAGVSISNVSNANIANMNVTDAIQNGVSLANDSQLQINSITADDNAAAGADISGYYTGLSIQDVTAQHNQTGVLLSSTNPGSGADGNLNITNINADNNQIGVNFSDASFVNVGTLTANDNTAGGVLFSNKASADDVGTLNATGNTGYGVDVSQYSVAASLGKVGGVNISNTQGDGVIENSTAFFYNLNSSNNTGDGISGSDASGMQLYLYGNTVLNNNNYAINMSNNSSDPSSHSVNIYADNISAINNNYGVYINHGYNDDIGQLTVKGTKTGYGVNIVNSTKVHVGQLDIANNANFGMVLNDVENSSFGTEVNAITPSQVTGNQQGVVVIGGSNNLTFDDLNAANNKQTAQFLINGGNAIALNNVTVLNTSQPYDVAGLYLNGTNTSNITVNDSGITGDAFSNVMGDDILIRGANHVKLDNINIQATDWMQGVLTNPNAIAIQHGANNVTLNYVNETATQQSNPGWADGLQMTGVNNVAINNSQFSGNSGDGIAIAAPGSGTNVNSSITNTTTNDNYGQGVDIKPGVSGVTQTGAKSENNKNNVEPNG
mgnify:FL=1